MSNSEPTGAPLHGDRVLSVADVSRIMGFCPSVASTFIKETGRGMTIHRRVFILESSLLSYLHEQESKSEAGR